MENEYFSLSSPKTESSVYIFIQKMGQRRAEQLSSSSRGRRYKQRFIGRIRFQFAVQSAHFGE